MIRWLLALLVSAFALPALADPPHPGDLLVITRGAPNDFAYGIVRVDPLTGSQTTLCADQAYTDIGGILITKTGEIYSLFSVQGASGGVARTDAATGTQELVSDGALLVQPLGICLDLDGALLVADVGTGPGMGSVVRVDPVTGFQTRLASASGRSNLIDIAVHPSGDILVVDMGDDPTPGGIYKVDRGSGALMPMTSAEFYPRGIAIDGNGNVYVNDVENVYRIQWTTGLLDTLYKANQYHRFWGMDVEGDGRLVLADGELRTIFRVDPATGSIAAVSANGHFAYPVGIAVWPSIAVPATPMTWGALKARYR